MYVYVLSVLVIFYVLSYNKKIMASEYYITNSFKAAFILSDNHLIYKLLVMIKYFFLRELSFYAIDCGVSFCETFNLKDL